MRNLAVLSGSFGAGNILMYGWNSPDPRSLAVGLVCMFAAVLIGQVLAREP